MRCAVGAAVAGAVIAVLIGTGNQQAVAPLSAIAFLAMAWSAARAAPRRLLGYGAGGGLISVLCTCATLAWEWPPLPLWGLVEVPALSIVVGLIARYSPRTWHASVSAAMAGLGAASCVVRFAVGDLSPLGAVYGLLAWAIVPAAAGLAGLYLRRHHVARADAVETARRAQRLELARDLHDYVAHDVTDMIAGVQAAQLIVTSEPDACSLLRRAESAGQRAMSSLDRTVALLHDRDPHDGGRSLPPDGLSELDALVERFTASGAIRVRLEIDKVLFAATPREIGATAHRVVVEALTNVRRHAPTASQVEVRLSLVGHDLHVLVDNDAAAGAASEAGRRRSSGTGLPALRERVEALGGAFTAGPHSGGWRLVATLPISSSRQLPT